MLEKTVFQKAEEQQLASAMGSGSLDVLATPAVAALMEYAASSLAADILNDDELTTVGTALSVEHISASPLGAEITATAKLLEQEGRVFRFAVSAADQKGEIARGTHTRVSVNAKAFQEKTDRKYFRYYYLLFDLDGTLSRSAEGIRASLEYAIQQLDVPMPDLSDYTRYIGPPLIDTFKNLVGLDDERAEIGAGLYRSYYNKRGKFLNRAYDGVRETVEQLHRQGYRMAVCTSKYEPFAREILAILELSDCFDAVCGSNIDGSRKDKRDLIPYAIKALGGKPERDKSRCVLLGDTWFDARGAKESGVDFIGVEYGYGDRESMEREGAVAFAASPQDIPGLLQA